MLAPRIARLVLAGTVGCAAGEDIPARTPGGSPHAAYEAQLRQVGLHTSALGRDWMTLAARTLQTPIPVTVPYREARYLDPASADAVAYRLALEQGQRIVARVDLAGAAYGEARLFLDLFFVSDSAKPPELVASAAASEWRLEHVALRRGSYLLRVQPELLRGGRVTVTISAHASLRFPVAGRTMAAIRSRFGASRDAGQRHHEGVDIFAPRGTPVLAAAAGRAVLVTRDRLGGNVVWLRDTAYGRRLYYAHLDRHAITEDANVKTGDTLGFVGNTGNARTTAPHLHFAVHLQRGGPVDPYFHLYEPPERPPAFAGDTGLVGRWGRVVPRITRVRETPSDTSPVITQVERAAPVRLLAGAGRWYRARLPDHREGYVPVADVQPLHPLRMTSVTERAVVRSEPTVFGFEMDSLARGQTVPLLGRYGAYALVRLPSGRIGWIHAAVIEAPRLGAR